MSMLKGLQKSNKHGMFHTSSKEGCGGNLNSLLWDVRKLYIYFPSKCLNKVFSYLWKFGGCRSQTSIHFQQLCLLLRFAGRLPPVSAGIGNETLWAEESNCKKPCSALRLITLYNNKRKRAEFYMHMDIYSIKIFSSRLHSNNRGYNDNKTNGNGMHFTV